MRSDEHSFPCDLSPKTNELLQGNRMQTRPRSISFIGWLQIIVSMTSIFGVLTSFTHPNHVEVLDQMNVSAMSYYITTTLSVVVNLTIGAGMLCGKNWSRYLYLCLMIYSLIWFYFNQPDMTDLVALIVWVVLSLWFLLFVFILFRPAANSFFKAAHLEV